MAATATVSINGNEVTSNAVPRTNIVGRSARNSKDFSITAMYLSLSADAEQDIEVEDELALAQRQLQLLKTQISTESKKNFILERDVRYLDSRIALLIQNRMALDEQNALESQLADAQDLQERSFPDDRMLQCYGNLFFLLQSEPRHIATLCRLVSLAEIDALLQTVMFTIYGNQYESREEHLLLTMFQSVLSTQFDSTLEFSSLLRANTPVSRMMTTYTRRGPGQSYLKLVLADAINALLEDVDTNLEVNPLKVYEEVFEASQTELRSSSSLPRSVSMELAAEISEVQSITHPRLVQLQSITNIFLNTILERVDQVPYGIRWICKQIRNLARRKYPDAGEEAYCTLIGGFFFLRYINPAIITPHAYMLVDRAPVDNPRRTLTLVAKILQNLANKPTYSKETYMVSLSPFVKENQQRVNFFLNKLCEIGDFYETLEMDQYIALSRKDLKLNITINELYGTHSLLEKYLDVLAPSVESQLRQILNDADAAPPLLPRSENGTIKLPLYSKFEKEISNLGDSLDITSGDVTYLETKSTFVQVIRRLPSQSSGTKSPLDLERIVASAAEVKDTLLVTKAIHALDMLQELAEHGAVNKNDNYNPLTSEIEVELAHLGSLREECESEQKSLRVVLKTVEDHNEYLHGQLETYKFYLQNARSQSGIAGDRVGLVSIGGRQKKQKKPQTLGPVKFSHQQLEREDVLAQTNIPEDRRSNVYFYILSQSPGTFVISLHYKGKSRGLLELELKIDDLLEMQQNHVEYLDLEYVQFKTGKLLQLLNKHFARKK